jgi:hypothetical protein
MKKQISIALAAGLLMCSVSVASATEMQRSLGTKMSSDSKMSPQSGNWQHNIYAGHNNSAYTGRSNKLAKGQQHATLARAPSNNVD